MLEIFYHMAYALAYAFVAAHKDKHVEYFDWKDGLMLPHGKAVRVTVEYVEEGFTIALPMSTKTEANLVAG